jgi:hypothetical protein
VVYLESVSMSPMRCTTRIPVLTRPKIVCLPEKRGACVWKIIMIAWYRCAAFLWECVCVCVCVCVCGCVDLHHQATA